MGWDTIFWDSQGSPKEEILLRNIWVLSKKQRYVECCTKILALSEGLKIYVID